MVVTYDEFIAWRDYADLFGDRDQSLVEDYLADSESDTSTVWGNQQARGIKLLTAHRLTIAADASTSGGYLGGQISSISASQGSQSISFGNPADSSLGGEQLGLTVFGQEYQAIKKTLPICGFTV